MTGVVDCVIIDAGHKRKMDLAIELPQSPLGAVMANEVWGEVYEKLVTADRTAQDHFDLREPAPHVRAAGLQPARTAGR
jgi:hypothetical protein